MGGSDREGNMVSDILMYIVNNPYIFPREELPIVLDTNRFSLNDEIKSTVASSEDTTSPVTRVFVSHNKIR